MLKHAEALVEAKIKNKNKFMRHELNFCLITFGETLCGSDLLVLNVYVVWGTECPFVVVVLNVPLSTSYSISIFP